MSHPIKQKSPPYHTFFNHDGYYSGVVNPLSYKTNKCSNQYFWDTVQKRILYKKYGVPYEWSSLDESVHLFNDNAYKDLTITFRDTVDNIEKFIEHPNIFVVSISQTPYEDVYGNYPTSDWPKGSYRVMREDGSLGVEEYSGNWVNGAFVRQEQKFFNEDGPDLTPSTINKLGSIGSLIRNSMYGRTGFDLYDSRVRPEFTDIINPDERMYNITFRISSEYFVVTHTMEYKLFDIIQSKFSGTNRTYLNCSQFLYALDMLNAVEKSGYYWMKLKKLEKKPAHDFDWSILAHEMGRISHELIQNKNENLNSNFS
jgi:hypothetical protein